MKKLLKAIVTFTLSVSMLTASFLFVGCDKDNENGKFQETQFLSDYGVTWSTDKVAKDSVFARTLSVGEKSCGSAEANCYGEVTLAKSNEKVKGLVLTSSTTLENRGGGYFTLGVRPNIDKCTFNGKEGRALIKLLFAPVFTQNRETAIFSISFSTASDKNNIITFESKPEGDGYSTWNVLVKNVLIKKDVKTSYIPADGSSKNPLEIYYDKKAGAFYFGYNGEFTKMYEKADGGSLVPFEEELRVCFGASSMPDSLINAINGGTYGNEAKSKSTKYVVTECNGYDFSKENFLIADNEFQLKTKDIKMAFDKPKDLLSNVKLAHKAFGTFACTFLNGGIVEVYKDGVQTTTVPVTDGVAMASISTMGNYVTKYKNADGKYLTCDGKDVELNVTVGEEAEVTAYDILDGVVKDNNSAKDPYLGEVYVKGAFSTVSGLVLTSSKIREGYTAKGIVNTVIGNLDLSHYTFDPITMEGESVISFCFAPQYKEDWEWNSVYVYFDYLDSNGDPILNDDGEPESQMLVLTSGDTWCWNHFEENTKTKFFPIDACYTDKSVSIKYDYKQGCVYLVYESEYILILDALKPDTYSDFMPSEYSGFSEVRIRIGHNTIQKALRDSIGPNDPDPGSIIVVTEFGGVDLTDF